MSRKESPVAVANRADREQDPNAANESIVNHTILQPGTALSGRYQLGAKIGEGAMAEVYQARDTVNDRDVAVKMMKSHLVGSAQRRFLREFNTIAAIDHPCCLKVYEFGETQQGSYFTMELCPGQHLTRLSDRTLEDVARPLVDVTLALDHIHGQGIVHRDVKPSNILVRSIDANGDGERFEAKLMDFGLARYYQADSSLTGDAGMVGTPAYCAPEQIDHRDLDYRADLYSLGLLAYELLSGGVYPFPDARATGRIGALLHAQLNEQPRQLSDINPLVPKSLSDVVASYLQKQAPQRPDSAAALRDCLCETFGIELDEQIKASATSKQLRLNSIGFVCRERELDEVDAYLARSIGKRERDELSSSAPSIVALVGEPGIGKSSVMRESMRRSRACGCQVFEARCFDGNRAPFQPFVDIIRQILSSVKPSRQHADAETTDYLGDASGGDGASGERIAERRRAIIHDYWAELLKHRRGTGHPARRRGHARFECAASRGSRYVQRQCDDRLLTDVILSGGVLWQSASAKSNGLVASRMPKQQPGEFRCPAPHGSGTLPFAGLVAECAADCWMTDKFSMA